METSFCGTRLRQSTYQSQQRQPVSAAQRMTNPLVVKVSLVVGCHHRHFPPGEVAARVPKMLSRFGRDCEEIQRGIGDRGLGTNVPEQNWIFESADLLG